MRFLISIEHPAWAHQFRYLIPDLERLGHVVYTVAINKDRDLELLDAFNIKYEVISDTAGRNLLEKGLIFLRTTWRIFRISRKFKPDMYIGRASPMMAINSFLSRKTHISFEDSEPSATNLLLCKTFSDVIITPEWFRKDLGRKQIRVNGFKELFYLHPNHFVPDPAIRDVLIPDFHEKYVLVRFVAWTAHHDVGQYGIIDKIGFVNELRRYARVYISSEGPLPPELLPYRLPLPPESIHHALYYATLFISDSQTMTAEAAILGTPAIRCNTFVGRKDMGNFIELERRFGLIFNFFYPEEALNKALELLNEENIKDIWKVKRDNMMREVIDMTRFFVWFIHRYPASYREMQRNPELQFQFS